MVTKPVEKNSSKKFRKFFKKIFQKPKKGQVEKYAKVKDVDRDAWLLQDHMGGSAVDIVHGDRIVVASDSPEKEDKEKDVLSEKGSKKLAKKQKNAKSKKLLVVQVNKEEKKIKTKIYEEITNYDAGNKESEKKTIPDSLRPKKDTTQSTDDLDSAMDDLFRKVERSSGAILGLDDGQNTADPESSVNEAAETKITRKKSRKEKKLSRSSLDESFSSDKAPLTDTESGYFDSDVTPRSSYRDSFGVNDARLSVSSRSSTASKRKDTGERDSLLSSAVIREEVLLRSVPEENGEKPSGVDVVCGAVRSTDTASHSALALQDSCDNVENEIILERVSRKSSRKSIRRSKKAKVPDEVTLCDNTPSEDKDSTRTESGYVWETVKPRNTDDRDTQSKRKLKHLFMGTKDTNFNSDATSEKNKQNKQNKDSSNEKKGKKMKIKLLKSKKKDNNKRYAKIGDEESREKQGSPRLRFPIRNLDGRSIEILDTFDFDDTDIGRKRLISESSEQEQKQKEKNEEKKKEKTQRKERKTKVVLDKQEPFKTRTYQEVVDNEIPGTSDGGKDTEPLAEPSRLSVRQVGQSVWGACKSGWKYMKAGLVMLAGSPAAGLSPNNTFRSHESEAGRSAHASGHY